LVGHPTCSTATHIPTCKLTLQTLHDEILSQQIEISGLGQRNAALQADNASLLQRWLDKMNLTADEMNAEFEREASSNSNSKDDKKEDFRVGGKT